MNRLCWLTICWLCPSTLCRAADCFRPILSLWLQSSSPFWAAHCFFCLFWASHWFWPDFSCKLFLLSVFIQYKKITLLWYSAFYGQCKGPKVVNVSILNNSKLRNSRTKNILIHDESAAKLLWHSPFEPGVGIPPLESWYLQCVLPS
jgi:hypothetical protein